MKRLVVCLLVLVLASASATAAVRTISIAYFNALRFGQGSSMCKDIGQFVEILKKHDVIVLGEVKKNTGQNYGNCAYGSATLGHIDALVDALNLNTTWTFHEPPWRYVHSPEPAGRSSSSEEYYVVIYREDEVHAYNQGTILSDPDDIFIRDPYAVTFGAWAFDFILLTIHAVGPGEEVELEAAIRELEEVYEQMQSGSPCEDDVILLGDFNVSESNDGWWDDLRRIEGMTALITENTSLGSTALANPYDKIWIDIDHTGHEHDMFCGSGIDEFWSYLCPDLTYQEFYQTHKNSTSDHVLVWAEFRVDLPDDD